MRGQGRLVVAAAVLLMLEMPPALGQSLEVGELTVVSASGDPIEGGGSATPFSLQLPDDATCPGDSRDEGYRVNSYMVPENVDPRDVTYDGLGPVPTKFGELDGFRMPLYQENSDFFVSIQTADADEPDAPGVILPLPRFDFDVYQPGDVPPGRYHVGIACTLLNEIERLWDAEIVVTKDPADAPAELAWTVADFEPGTDDSTSLIPIAGVLAAGAALVVVVRRRRPAPTAPRRNE